MFTPNPETMKKTIAPGLWVDKDNFLHFDAHAWCAGAGYDASPQNCETAELLLRRIVKEYYSDLPVYVDEY